MTIAFVYLGCRLLSSAYEISIISGKPSNGRGHGRRHGRWDDAVSGSDFDNESRPLSVISVPALERNKQVLPKCTQQMLRIVEPIKDHSTALLWKDTIEGHDPVASFPKS